MPMTQADIRQHYEGLWKQVDDSAKDVGGLLYSNPVEDAVVAPVYRQLARDLRIAADGGAILDVGCGAGRWVRHLLEWFRPASFVGIDVAQSSADLLKRFHGARPDCRIAFRAGDITSNALDLGEQFDLINIANVLFHVPEQELFMQALRNLVAALAPGGTIITTEYLPRITMRTNWMLVRSRYEFEAALAAVGLRIVAVRAFSFFGNDPMGVDGPDAGTRGVFGRVKAGFGALQSAKMDDGGKAFIQNLLVDVERACLEFCGERISDIDMPSQKLVALRRVDE